MRIVLVALVGVVAGVFVACTGTGFEEGDAAYKNGDYVEALRIWKPLAERGHAKAQSYVGLMYSQGEGVPQDHAEAASWFLKSAEQGYGRAQFNLGVVYLHGEGLPQDLVQAYMWFLLAEQHGVEQAADGLARCADQMTEDELDEAEELAREWRPRS